MSRTRNLYSTKDKEYMLNKVNMAKSKKLELGPVYQHLADKYGVSLSAMKQTVRRIRLEKISEVNTVTENAVTGDKTSVTTTQVEQLEIELADQEETLVDKLDRMMKELDFYKSQYERAMKLLGSAT